MTEYQGIPVPHLVRCFLFSITSSLNSIVKKHNQSNRRTHIFSSVSIQKFSNNMECNGVVRVIFQLQQQKALTKHWVTLSFVKTKV